MNAGPDRGQACDRGQWYDRGLALFAVGGLILLVALTVAVGSGFAPVLQIDAAVAACAAATGPQLVWWTPLGWVLSIVLGPWAWRLLAAAWGLWWLLRERGRPSWAGVPWLVGAVLAGGLVPLAVKAVVQRPRPLEVLVPVTQTSYPSGHAFAITVAAVVAVLALGARLHRRGRILLGLLAAALVVLVCLARVLLVVHNVSDVLAGCALGLVWLGLLRGLSLCWAPGPQAAVGSGTRRR